MRLGHFSPVIVRIKVRKEVPKVRKWLYSFNYPLGITSANRYIPRIEKIRFIKSKRPPILIMPGILIRNDIKVFLRLLLRLKNKNIRRILNDLIMVV